MQWQVSFAQVSAAGSCLGINISKNWRSGILKITFPGNPTEVRVLYTQPFHIILSKYSYFKGTEFNPICSLTLILSLSAEAIKCYMNLEHKCSMFILLLHRNQTEEPLESYCSILDRSQETEQILLEIIIPQKPKYNVDGQNYWVFNGYAYISTQSQEQNAYGN